MSLLTSVRSKSEKTRRPAALETACVPLLPSGPGGVRHRPVAQGPVFSTLSRCVSGQPPPPSPFVTLEAGTVRLSAHFPRVGCRPPSGHPSASIIHIPLRGGSTKKASTERQGFEPWVPLRVLVLSRHASSAAPAPLLTSLAERRGCGDNSFFTPPHTATTILDRFYCLSHPS